MSLIIKADGASRGNPGEASYGAVLFDGETEIATTSAHLGVATNNFAEYSGVIAGLKLALNHDPKQSYLVQLDSKLVVEQLKGNWKVKSRDLMPMVSEASALASKLSVSFEWIPREQNARADELANEALDKPVAKAIPDQPGSIRAPRVSSPGTEIIFVRHGHSSHTEKGLVSGGDGADPELSDLGQREAEATAELLAHPPSSWRLAMNRPLVIASPMLRTKQTAEAIARRLNAESVLDERIKEIFFGDWNGLSNEELFSKDPDLLASWRGSLDFRPPGGESIEDLVQRISSFVEQIRTSKPNRTVIVVSHMMPTRALTHQIIGGDESYLWSTSFAPASISAFRVWGSEQHELITLNSCAHLPIK